jgi:uncharacterized protein (TIGR00369 family)
VELDAEKIQEIVDESPFAQFSGFRVTAADKENQRLTMEMPLRPEFERIADTGQIHGGPIAALIDTAGCFAIVMMTGKTVPTISFSTEYLRPASNTLLTATASVRKNGRSISVVDIDVKDDNDKLIATGRGLYSTSS